MALVGLPLLVRGKLYNCAAVLCRGRLLGLVPKTYLPNYGEFYEKRQFTPGSTEVETLTVCGQQVPFGTSLLFRCREMPSFVLGVELCEDLWSALPAFHLPRAGRSHRHCEPLRQRRDGRQGGVPPGAGGQPVRPPALRLPVCLCRAR